MRRRVDAGREPAHHCDAPAREPSGELLSPPAAVGRRLAGSHDRHPASIVVAGSSTPHEEGRSLVDHEELAGVLSVQQSDEMHPLLLPFSDLSLDRIQGFVRRVRRCQEVQLAGRTIMQDRQRTAALLDLLRDSRPSPTTVTQQVEKGRALCHLTPHGCTRTYVRPCPAGMQAPCHSALPTSATMTPPGTRR